MSTQKINKESVTLVEASRLASKLANFAAERDWQKFDSPKNLVMALSGEIGELTEIFQWLCEVASRIVGSNPATAKFCAGHSEDHKLVKYLPVCSARGDNRKARTG